LSDRVKDDPTLRPQDPTQDERISAPVIIVHKVLGDYQFLIFPAEVDPPVTDPRAFGILISDIIDHIARCYYDVTGMDERLIREGILRIVRDEQRFKDKDPTRGHSRGTTLMPKN
jgi:hypothetical protein